LYRGISSLFAVGYESHSILEHSGKLQVLSSLLSTVYATQREKVVVVSSYTSVCRLLRPPWRAVVHREAFLFYSWCHVILQKG